METPSFDRFVSQVKSKRRSVVSADFYKSELGHSMFVQGYATAIRQSNGQRINTLAVADGWYDSAVYLAYDPADYRMTHGAFFSA